MHQGLGAIHQHEEFDGMKCWPLRGYPQQSPKDGPPDSFTAPGCRRYIFHHQWRVLERLSQSLGGGEDVVTYMTFKRWWFRDLPKNMSKVAEKQLILSMILLRYAKEQVTLVNLTMEFIRNIYFYHHVWPFDHHPSHLTSPRPILVTGSQPILVCLGWVLSNRYGKPPIFGEA